MATIPLSKLISALGLLSPAERGMVRAALDGLAAPKTHGEAPQRLYDAIAAACSNTMPFAVYQTTKSGKLHWRKKSAVALDWLTKTFPNLRLPVEQALLRMLLGALITDLKERQAPISIHSVVLSLDRLPMIFDALFPDYAASGLQHMVIAALIRGGK